MKEHENMAKESAVELMIKAALRDDVQTTIRRGPYPNTIEVAFHKKGERISVFWDVADNSRVPYQGLFWAIKSSLKRLLTDAYERIGTAPKEDDHE